MSDAEYQAKLLSVQRFLPFLENMIQQLNDPSKKSRIEQKVKMERLYEMVVDSTKRLKLPTLTKCEDAIIKLYRKIRGENAPFPASPRSTPASPSPTIELERSHPIEIPTENKRKPVIDIYNSAGVSLAKSPKNLRENDCSKFSNRPPPISVADLEELQSNVSLELDKQLSLNELNDLRSNLYKQIEENDCQYSGKDKKFEIDTTARNKPVFSKVGVVSPEKSVKSKIVVKPQNESPKSVASTVKKVDKSVEEPNSIFKSIISSIDDSISRCGKRGENVPSTCAEKKNKPKNETKEQTQSKSESEKSKMESKKVESCPSKNNRESPPKKKDCGDKTPINTEGKVDCSKPKTSEETKKGKETNPFKKDVTEEIPAKVPSEPTRLAYKYNPKPKKVYTDVDVDKQVQESIEKSMKISPVKIPFLDEISKPPESVAKPLPPPIKPPENLLSPNDDTVSSHSSTSFSNILANPATTDLIKTVVTQLRISSEMKSPPYNAPNMIPAPILSPDYFGANSRMQVPPLPNLIPEHLRLNMLQQGYDQNNQRNANSFRNSDNVANFPKQGFAPFQPMEGEFQDNYENYDRAQNYDRGNSGGHFFNEGGRGFNEYNPDCPSTPFENFQQDNDCEFYPSTPRPDYDSTFDMQNQYKNDYQNYNNRIPSLFELPAKGARPLEQGFNNNNNNQMGPNRDDHFSRGSFRNDPRMAGRPPGLLGNAPFAFDSASRFQGNIQPDRRTEMNNPRMQNFGRRDPRISYNNIDTGRSSARDPRTYRDYKEQKERENRARELKEREMKEKELKEKEMKEREIKEKELKEKDMQKSKENEKKSIDRTEEVNNAKVISRDPRRRESTDKDRDGDRGRSIDRYRERSDDRRRPDNRSKSQDRRAHFPESRFDRVYGNKDKQVKDDFISPLDSLYSTNKERTGKGYGVQPFRIPKKKPVETQDKCTTENSKTEGKVEDKTKGEERTKVEEKAKAEEKSKVEEKVKGEEKTMGEKEVKGDEKSKVQEKSKVVDVAKIEQESKGKKETKAEMVKRAKIEAVKKTESKKSAKVEESIQEESTVKKSVPVEIKPVKLIVKLEGLKRRKSAEVAKVQTRPIRTRRRSRRLISDSEYENETFNAAVEPEVLNDANISSEIPSLTKVTSPKENENKDQDIVAEIKEKVVEPVESDKANASHKKITEVESVKTQEVQTDKGLEPNDKEVDKPVEKNEIEKSLEQNETEKPVEKNEIEKPVEKKEIEKPVEKNEIEKRVEKNKIEKPVEKNEIEKSVEKNETEKPVEKKDESIAGDQNILVKFLSNLMGSSNKNERKGAIRSLINTFADSFTEHQVSRINRIIECDKDSSDEEGSAKSTKKELSVEETSKDSAYPVLPEEKVETKEMEISNEIETAEADIDDLNVGLVEEAVLVSVGERIKSRKRTIYKPKIKHKKSELDKLHDDIKDMFIRDGVVTASGKRMCRLLKDGPALSEKSTLSTTLEIVESSPKKIRKKPGPKSKTIGVIKKKLKLNQKDNIRDIRVLLPKISLDELMYEENKRYKLRNNLRKASYTESEAEEEKVDAIEIETRNESLKESEAKKKVIRKKRSSWATGVIKKSRKKNKSPVEVNREEAEPEPEVLKIREELIPDKAYFMSPTIWKLKCKLCRISHRFLALHYKNVHPDVEVLCSRLAPQIAKQAIKESLANGETFTADDAKTWKKMRYKCRVCDFESCAAPKFFYDHLSTHTGEFRYSCNVPECHFARAHQKAVHKHVKDVHDDQNYVNVRTLNIESNKNWYGYLCSECNYFQIDKISVVKHVEVYHYGENVKVHRIKLNYYALDRNAEASDVSDVSSTMENDANSTIDSTIDSNFCVPDDETDSVASFIAKPKTPKRKTRRARVKQPAIAGDETSETETEPEKFERLTTTPPTKKIVDKNVFTCATDSVEENRRIEEERLKRMEELNNSIKTRTSLDFVEKLSNRLKEDKVADLKIKDEPFDEADFALPPPRLQVYDKSKKVTTIPESLKYPPKSLENAKSGNDSISRMVEKLQENLQNTPEEESNEVQPPEILTRPEILPQFDEDILPPLLERVPNPSDRGQLDQDMEPPRLELQPETALPPIDMDLPPPLKQISELRKPIGENVPTLNLGPLRIIKKQDNYHYVCQIPSCFFWTKEQQAFSTHGQFAHAWDAHAELFKTCLKCEAKLECDINVPILISFFNHALKAHSDFLGYKVGSIRVSNNLFPEKAKTVCLEDDKVEEKELSPPVKAKTPEPVEENSFFFKISEVVSLADEDDLPPALDAINSKQTSCTSDNDKVVEESAIEQARFLYTALFYHDDIDSPYSIENCCDAEHTLHLVGGVLKKTNGENLICNLCNDTISSLHARDHYVQIHDFEPDFVMTPPKASEEFPTVQLSQEVGSAVAAKKAKGAHEKFLKAFNDLYKCPEFSCYFTCSRRKMFEVHVKMHKALTNVYCCLYCEEKLRLEQFAAHYDDQHLICRFSCQLCFYRCIAKDYIDVHNLILHPLHDPSQMHYLSRKDNEDFNLLSAIAKTPKSEIVPYRCCDLEFYFYDEFSKHLNEQCNLSHLKCCEYRLNALQCFEAFTADKLLAHWRDDHKVYPLHCAYCTYGHKEPYDLMVHLVRKHANLPPDVLDRRCKPIDYKHAPDMSNVKRLHCNFVQLVDDIKKQKVRVVIRDVRGVETTQTMQKQFETFVQKNYPSVPPSKQTKASPTAKASSTAKVSPTTKTAAPAARILPPAVAKAAQQNQSVVKVVPITGAAPKSLVIKTVVLSPNRIPGIPVKRLKGPAGLLTSQEKFQIVQQTNAKSPTNSTLFLQVPNLTPLRLSSVLKTNGREVKIVSVPKPVDGTMSPTEASASSAIVDASAASSVSPMPSPVPPVASHEPEATTSDPPEASPPREEEMEDDPEMPLLILNQPEGGGTRHLNVGGDIISCIMTKDNEPLISISESADEIPSMDEIDPLSLEDDLDVSSRSACPTPLPDYDYSSDAKDAGAGNVSKKIGLISYQLYRCIECEGSFSNASNFKDHITKSAVCRSDKSSSKPFQCVHCEKFFKNANSLVDHISYHGVLRFTCTLCNVKFHHVNQVRAHMRQQHKVLNVITTPINPNKNDLNWDEFVVRPKPTETPQELPKEATNDDSLKARSTPEPKTEYYPHEIDQLPLKSVYGYMVTCGQCKTFQNKVRLNLYRHFQNHLNEAPVSGTAPVNPVPCLEKNEKMFDKMFNMAISSVSTTVGRMGGPKSDKKEKPEVKTNLPGFIPSSRRFVCCAEDCSYICHEDSNLRHHLMALHAEETSFACPHCRTALNAVDVDGVIKHLKLHDLHLYKCAACDFLHSLRHKVERHVNDKHDVGEGARVVTIRAMDSEPYDESQPMGSILVAGNQMAFKVFKPWRCNICKYRTLTEEEVSTHALNKHFLDTRYKCTLCSYKSNDDTTFAEHFRTNHDDREVDMINAYYKTEEELPKAPNADVSGTPEIEFDTTPLWRRDRPGVLKNIRGILVEDSSPVKSTKKSPTKNAVHAAEYSEAVKKPSEVVKKLSEVVKKPLGRKRSASTFEEAPESKREKLKERRKSVAAKEVSDEDDVIIIDDEDERGGGDNFRNFAETNDLTSGLTNTHERLSTNDLFDIIKVETVVAGAAPDEVDLICKFGDLGMPANGMFTCPTCGRRSRKLQDFYLHLIKELKCLPYSCKSCLMKFATKQSMNSHSKNYHKSVKFLGEPVQTREVKEKRAWVRLVIERQLEILKSLNKYTASMKQVASMFSDFEDDEASESASSQNEAPAEVESEKEEEEQLEIEITKVEERAPSPPPPLPVAKKRASGSAAPKSVAAKRARASSSVSGAASRPYVCAYCDESTSTRDEIRVHWSAAHPNELFDYSFGKKPFVKKPTTKIGLNERVRCGHCDEEGSEEHVLTHHSELHPNELPSSYRYRCSECPARFSYLRGFRTHFRMHKIAKVTYVDLDGKVNLINEKPQNIYSCPKCPYKSQCADLTNIKQHLRRHARHIMCAICQAKFVSRSDAKNHHNKEHENIEESIVELPEQIHQQQLMIEIVKASAISAVDVQDTPEEYPPRKLLNFARKSTGGIRKKPSPSISPQTSQESDLDNLWTTVEIEGEKTVLTGDEIAQQYDLDPVVRLENCKDVTATKKRRTSATNVEDDDEVVETTEEYL